MDEYLRKRMHAFWVNTDQEKIEILRLFRDKWRVDWYSFMIVINYKVRLVNVE